MIHFRICEIVPLIRHCAPVGTFACVPCFVPTVCVCVCLSVSECVCVCVGELERGEGGNRTAVMIPDMFMIEGTLCSGA